MAKLEFIKFASEDAFKKAIKALLNGETVKHSYKDKEGKTVEYNLVSNKRLYLGNNFSLSLSEDDKHNLYLGVEYFSAQDRINVAKINKETKDF